MKIKRTLNTNSATYDLQDLTDEEFSILCKAYEHYMFYIRHCLPTDKDAMWQKMNKLQEERITIL